MPRLQLCRPMSARRGSHKRSRSEHSQQNETARPGCGRGAVHRTSAPSAACFTWASPPVPRCERPRKRRSQELPQGRGGGWSCGKAAPAPPRLRPSFSSRGVLAPHADEALERQHWAPGGSRLRPHQAARARLSRKRQRNAFSSSAHSVNAKKPSLMCLMK